MLLGSNNETTNITTETEKRLLSHTSRQSRFPCVNKRHREHGGGKRGTGMTREDIKTINDIVHKTIYGFFDICGDKETPMTDKDKLLLEVNKAVCNNIKDLEQEQKTGHCKDCKYFEYDSVAKVDGIPLIVAHEICKRWGDGCKTSENGYCFLFEPQESEEQA
jgi:hypothetical protein